MTPDSTIQTKSKSSKHKTQKEKNNGVVNIPLYSTLESGVKGVRPRLSKWHMTPLSPGRVSSEQLKNRLDSAYQHPPLRTANPSTHKMPQYLESTDYIDWRTPAAQAKALELAEESTPTKKSPKPASNLYGTR